MNETALISVIMPVYNEEKYLRKSVQSILDQTFPHFEFIIINDGSSDRSAEILDQFAQTDKRIQIVHQENKGLATSLNVGLQMARGKFIARMDADDISLPKRLEIQSGILLNDNSVGVCHSRFSLIDSEGKAIPFRKRAGFRFSSLQTRWTLIWRNCIGHPTVMIRREILNKYNLSYNVSAICEDYDLWCRLIEVTEFVAIRQPLLLHRLHSESFAANHGEQYLISCSDIIDRNLNKYIDFSLNQKELRKIVLISGQVLRGKNNTYRIDAKFFICLVDAVTSRFIELHAIEKSSEKQIQRAAAQQFVRWAQQAWYHNKTAAIRFLLTGLSRCFSM
jgi:glycosyltransferase involved in cell wall biosynthesis